MDNKINLSVVVATYNGEKYVKEQIESIISQTYKPAEIIIVDDNSTDNTVCIVESLLKASNINYMIIVHSENQGIGCTFEDGIKNSNSPYIMLCDQDDVWGLDKIKISIETICKNEDSVLVVTNASITDENLVASGKNMFDYISFPGVFVDGVCKFNSEEAKLLFFKRNYVTGMCLIVKREVAQAAIPFSKNMTYDAWLAWVATDYGEIVFLEDELVKYRQHKDNAIGIQKKRESLIKYLENRKTEKIKIRNKYLDFGESIEFQMQNLYKNLLKFLNWRCTLSNTPRLKGLYQIINNYRLYADYTTKPYKEIGKDLLEVLLVKRYK